MTQRRVSKQLLVYVIALITVITACGDESSPSESTAVPTTVSEEADAETSAASDSSVPLEATTSTTTTTVPPPSTEDPLLDLVYVGPEGTDEASGAEASSAVSGISAAVERLAPGGTIALLPGTHRPLQIEGIHGTPDQPIQIVGGAGAIIEDVDYRTGAGISIRDSSHVEISGLTVRRALWGIYVASSNNIALRSNDVADIGQEAIRITEASTDVVIEGNRVADTGRRTDIETPNGEGIYIGTGSPLGVDMVQRVVIRNNLIERTSDEAIDIKSPAREIQIVGNEIYDIATNTSGAVVIHLGGDTADDPNIRVEQNIIRNVTRTSPFMDGNCIVVQVSVTIVNNVLHGCQHRGIYVRGSEGVARIEHNTLIDSGEVADVETEGRGQNLDVRNNLGVGGDANRTAESVVFADLSNGDYRLTPEAAASLSDAPALGVLVDLLGRERSASGDVTFGAVEAAPR